MLRFEKIKKGENPIIMEIGYIDESQYIDLKNIDLEKIKKDREIDIQIDYPCIFKKNFQKIIDNEIIEQVLKNREIELPTQKFPFRIFRDEPINSYDLTELKVEEHYNISSTLDIKVFSPDAIRDKSRSDLPLHLESKTSGSPSPFGCSGAPEGRVELKVDKNKSRLKKIRKKRPMIKNEIR
jgi:hypothetical protein